MQCASCQFENMPGTQLCVHCGASLQIALAGANVHPPRAGRMTKTIRVLLPARRVYHVSRDAIVAVPARSFFNELLRPVEIGELTPAVIVRMAVPGWAQASLGNRVRAAVVAAAYWPCLLYAIVAFGSSAGALALGIAFAIHAGSLIDVLTSEEVGLFQRMCVVPIVVAIPLAAFYWGLGSTVSSFVLARRLVQGAPPFSVGDVVLTHRRAYVSSPPRPGDVVLFWVPDRAEGFRVSNVGREAAFFRIDGERIDRVIAGPRSVVRWDGERLWINDQASSIRPLNPQRLPASLSIVVPDDHFAIFLTTDGLLGPTTPLPVWRFVCLVPSDRIIGRTFLRNYPWSQWWWIR